MGGNPSKPEEKRPSEKECVDIIGVSHHQFGVLVENYLTAAIKPIAFTNLISSVSSKSRYAL